MTLNNKQSGSTSSKGHSGCILTTGWAKIDDQHIQKLLQVSLKLLGPEIVLKSLTIGTARAVLLRNSNNGNNNLDHGLENSIWFKFYP